MKTSNNYKSVHMTQEPHRLTPKPATTDNDKPTNSFTRATATWFAETGR